MRNDGNGNFSLVYLRNGEADSLDRDRTLFHDVTGKRLRDIYPQPVIVAAFDFVQREKFPSAIHMTLHNVSAEAGAGFHGKLKVHSRSRGKTTQRSAGK